MARASKAIQTREISGVEFTVRGVVRIHFRAHRPCSLVLDTGTVRNIEVPFELPMLECGEKIALTCSYAAADMQRDQQDLLV